MEALKEKTVLISGASIARLTAAYWMNKLNYRVTMVELATAPRMGGTAVDLRAQTLEIARRMGILEQLKSKALSLETIEFKNANDHTENSVSLKNGQQEYHGDEIEIERTSLIGILFEEIKSDVEFIFSNSITALSETNDAIWATFKGGSERSFALLFGCDGTHSGVRKIWFGEESEYAHFSEAYFSVTIVDKTLIKPNTMQFYNVPGKACMLNTYKNKTDIVFCFSSEQEIPYNYHDEQEQRKIISERFEGQSWRTTELLEDVRHSKNFYFDKLCQIRMPSWTKGRVALMGDAAYCASPAAGMGGSLAIEGTTTLTDALEKYGSNYALAFQEYNQSLRPFIEEVQAAAVKFGLESLVPKTEEAICKRNTQGF